MSTEEREIDLGHGVKLIQTIWNNHTSIPTKQIEIEYVNQSTDHWHKDREEYVDIDNETCKQVVSLLIEHLEVNELLFEVDQCLEALEANTTNSNFRMAQSAREILGDIIHDLQIKAAKNINLEEA